MKKMVPRGLEPRTLRLLAVRSNQLSYETVDLAKPLEYKCVVLRAELRLRQVPCGARIRISREALNPELPSVVVSSLNLPVCHAAELLLIENTVHLAQDSKENTPKHIALHPTLHCTAMHVRQRDADSQPFDLESVRLHKHSPTHDALARFPVPIF